METENQNLTLPVKIPYEVLQQLTDKVLIGMEIGTGERKQGRILSTSIGASALPEYDVVLGLKLRVLRRILMAKEVEVFIQVSLAYDTDLGEISVDTYKIASKSKNFLLDKTLQILANRMYYDKILDKATYNFNTLIDPHLLDINEKLASGITFAQAITLRGNMKKITVTQIDTLPDHVLVHISFRGGAELSVQQLPDTNFNL